MKDYRGLMDTALRMRENAYAPYSHFTVGAALLCDNGKVYTGCNVENSAFSPSICAERTAFAKAVSEGDRHFTAIAIAGGAADEKAARPCPPCGVCRQVMQEFCDPQEFKIVLLDGENLVTYPFKALFPAGFKL